uniref:Uncharacterized protein LOC100181388 n=1 Tax=Phallusia mammillata TaxID=59560 RepID=A0A6F9DHH1_9ASCI|nr:uncharacterized protein LOC100181388 [Phallusia mammillata]
MSIELTAPAEGQEINSKRTLLDQKLVADASEHLSQQFFTQFAPKLKQAVGKLDDVIQNQSVLTESLKHEHERIKEANVNEVQIAMTLVNHYRGKLIKIQKDMTSIKESSEKLRREASRLQQVKQREQLKLDEQREKEIAEDQQLVATFSNTTINK